MTLEETEALVKKLLAANPNISATDLQNAVMNSGATYNQFRTVAPVNQAANSGAFTLTNPGGTPVSQFVTGGGFTSTPTVVASGQTTPVSQFTTGGGTVPVGAPPRAIVPTPAPALKTNAKGDLVIDTSNLSDQNDGTFYGVTTINGKQIIATTDADGNLIRASSVPSSNTQNSVITQYDSKGNPVGTSVYQPQQTGGFTGALGTIAKGLGGAALGIAFPGLATTIGSALGASAGMAATVGGAALGGLTSAAVGGNPLTGAALGGLGGYLQGTGGVGSYIDPGVSDNIDMGGGQNFGGTPNMGNYINPGVSDNIDIGGGFNPATAGQTNAIANNPGYYNEITGQYMQDPLGGLQNPLTNETSGTNLSSMNGYSYDPATGTWTSPDGTQTATRPGGASGVTGGQTLLTNAGAGAGAAAAGAAGAGAGAGVLGTGLTAGQIAALGSGVGSLLSGSTSNNAITNAQNIQNAAAAKSQSTLSDIYNQNLAFTKPYQDVGVQGVNAIQGNMPYFQHQFDANDLTTNLAPNYAFQLGQGQMANQRAANVGGGALSGNTLTGLNRYTQDYAGNAYQQAFNNYNAQRNNIYNTLSNIAGIGNTANSQAIGAGNTYGTNTTNLATGLAAAQAGATVAQGQNNANTLNNLVNNTALLLSQNNASPSQGFSTGP